MRRDPRWTGIVEVLVWGLDGTVRFEPDSVVLQLPHGTRPGRVADLDLLRVCLGRAGVPVMFDASAVNRRDASLSEFLLKLTEAGLLKEVSLAVA